jgi:aspartyl-tRNA(Asn)/glutamyl-tRNA(Gln) amidotransferase subunit C
VAVTKEDVKKVAALSRLYIAESEMDAFRADLGAVVEHAEKLNELDTSDVQPTAHILPVKNVLREDIVRPSMDREAVTGNAPEKEGGCYIVPRVVE